MVTWVALSGAPAFQRVLQQRPCAKSDHFALHCLRTTELSTGKSPMGTQPVDDLPAQRPAKPIRKRPDCPRLGLVVPKRHARRSVTRSLIKRQMRQAAQTHAEALAPGMLVLRLTTAFAVAQFPSAASPALRQAVRAELTQLFQRGRRAGPHA